jgi:hypothetical protein
VRLHRSLRLHEVDVHRRVGCGSYAGCLDRASRSAWLSFTCVRCFALRYLAAGRGNRMFPSTELWLAFHRAPDRTQL